MDEWIRSKAQLRKAGEPKGLDLTSGTSPAIGIAWSGASLSDRYAASVRTAGGQVVYLPQVTDLIQAQTALRQAEGLLLIGGGDIAAPYYGQENSRLIERVDPERDLSEYWTLQAALDQDLPILAVCRGFQWLNVIRGGSLYQDLPAEYPSRVVHREPGRKEGIFHGITIVSGTLLCGMVSSGEICVNSLHHQAIRILGHDLKVSARSYDGLIEAIEASDKVFVVGVQFHPERMVGQGMPLFLSLFKRLVTEASRINQR